MWNEKKNKVIQARYLVYQDGREEMLSKKALMDARIHQLNVWFCIRQIYTPDIFILSSYPRRASLLERQGQTWSVVGTKDLATYAVYQPRRALCSRKPSPVECRSGKINLFSFHSPIHPCSIFVCLNIAIILCFWIIVNLEANYWNQRLLDLFIPN